MQGQLEGTAMSAGEALRAAQEAAVTVMFDGESLVLEAKAEPPQAVLNALSRHKLAAGRGAQDGRPVVGAAERRAWLRVAIADVPCGTIEDAQVNRDPLAGRFCSAEDG